MVGFPAGKVVGVVVLAGKLTMAGGGSKVIGERERDVEKQK